MHCVCHVYLLYHPYLCHRPSNILVKVMNCKLLMEPRTFRFYKIIELNAFRVREKSAPFRGKILTRVRREQVEGAWHDCAAACRNTEGGRWTRAVKRTKHYLRDGTMDMAHSMKIEYRGSERKRTLGRFRPRWKDNIQEASGELLWRRQLVLGARFIKCCT